MPKMGTADLDASFLRIPTLRGWAIPLGVGKAIDLWWIRRDLMIEPGWMPSGIPAAKLYIMFVIGLLAGNWPSYWPPCSAS